MSDTRVTDDAKSGTEAPRTELPRTEAPRTNAPLTEAPRPRVALPESDLDIRWVMPEGFHELPLQAETMDETAEQLVELAREVLPGADFELQLHWALMCAANYGTFVGAGVQYAGFCLTEVDGVHCTATVQISEFALDEEPGKDPAGFLAMAMRHLREGRVSELDLPCGPAASCVGRRRIDVDGSLTEDGEETAVWSSFIQVMVPLVNGNVLCLEMSTPTEEGWEVFSSMFAGIVKSVRIFEGDDEGDDEDGYGERHMVVMPGAKG